MKTVLVMILFVIVFSAGLSSAAVTESSRADVMLGSGPARPLAKIGFDRVICVDGLKLFQTIGPGWGDGAAPAVSTIQLYEERGGKVVPVKCSK
ncbi:MAG: hypothetical protein KKB30_04985 [Proteobacteria bacterium]|nr:hypothetical protein [Pseudomonadota bacterium]MBU1715588.1 hypothetical protein [Pseudomonadota bacterium]